MRGDFLHMTFAVTLTFTVAAFGFVGLSHCNERAAMSSGTGGTPIDPGPVRAATKWAGDLGLKVRGKPVCATYDSDDDGYVTCTIATEPDDKHEAELISVECASENPFHLTEGCKLAQPKVKRTR